MLRLDDPDDNHGRGWQQATTEDIAEFLYFTVRTLPRCAVRDLKARNPNTADEAARRISRALADRLAPYAIFRAARLPRAFPGFGGPTDKTGR